jgi:hypothetical protein
MFYRYYYKSLLKSTQWYRSLKLNATLSLFYAEDFTLLRENIPTVKKVTEHLSVASPEFGAEMYRKLSTMLITRENTWQNHNIKTAYKSSERKAKFNLSQLIIQRDATIHSLFIAADCCTCFG